jgi:hypothetical protein
MIRKLTFAMVATAALGAAALAPTSASAHGWGGGWHGGWHHGWGGPGLFVGGPYYGYYGGGCLVRRWVGTPWGPQIRLVNVC